MDGMYGMDINTPQNRLVRFSLSTYMSRKGPEVGLGMLDFVEDCCLGVKSH